MAKIITFGEIMLRLNPEGYNRIVQADKFCINFSGAESNVAVALSNFCEQSVFVSKVPQNEIGQAAINELRKFGVNTEHILRGGERLGVFYVEKGASQRPSKVIYDRKNSSIATASESEFDFEKIFDKADWFHFTGITAALSKDMQIALKRAVKLAKKQNITVSCDINYRSKLWSKDEAQKTMTELMQNVDVIIANEADASDVFGITADNNDVNCGKLNKQGYQSIAEELMKRFGCKLVAFTLRESISASDNGWQGMLFDGKESFTSCEYPIHIVDRIGGGDSFASGLIYALLNKYTLKEAVEFATAASCLKHSIEGDLNLVTVDEIKSLICGNKSGRVER